jgi:hypothetical protein
MLKHRGARRGLRALVLLTTAAFAAGVVAQPVGAASAKAAAKAPKPPTVAQLGASYLADQITTNGGYVESFGAPDPTNTAYAVIGLHAAKIGPRASDEAITYLEGQLTDAVQSGGTDAPGALAEYIMAAVSAGLDPHHFGGNAPQNDLVARLLATQRTTGNDAGLFGAQDPTFDGSYREGLALQALKAAKVKKNDPHVASALTWLTRQQCANGLWEAYRAGTSAPCDPADPTTFTGPDTNSSAMAAQGLAAWGKKPRKSTAISALHALQSTDGGFPFVAAGGQASDPNSTALVTQMLVALGSSPKAKAWARAGGTPLTALAGYQLGCSDPAPDRGAFFFPGDRSANTFATVQAVPAAALQKFPVAKSKNLGAPIAPVCPTVTSATLTAATFTGKPCSGSTGVTVVVDLSAFGQGVRVGCAAGAPATGLAAMQAAGFTTTGTTQYGDAFVCRIDDEPDPTEQSCKSTPPANAYWAYYHAKPGDKTWTFSTVGASSFKPAPGTIDGWAFGASAVPSVTPAQVRPK